MCPRTVSVLTTRVGIDGCRVEQVKLSLDRAAGPIASSEVSGVLRAVRAATCRVKAEAERSGH